MSTDLLAADAAVRNVAIMHSPIMTSTGNASELTSFADVVSHVMIESLPAKTDRIGTAMYAFAKRLQRLPEVRAVAHAADLGVYIVWTFIGQRNKELRQRVYAEERRLMEEFPELTFDFNVVAFDQYFGGPLLPDDLQGQLVFYRHS